MERKKSLLGKILLVAGIAALLTVSFFTVRAVKVMSRNYQELRNTDCSRDLSGTVFYDDGLYAVLGYGIELDSRETGNQERMDEFLSSSLRHIDERFCAAAVIYTLVIVTVIALFCMNVLPDIPER